MMETGMIRTILVAAMLAAAPALSMAATLNFHADLKGSSEVPPTGSAGTGTLTATLDTSTDKLDYTLTWSGLTGAATMAHFHGPAAVGKNAGVQVVLGGAPMGAMAMGPMSPAHGTVTLTAAQISQLEAGQWYANVHTKKFPKGEIRGQVLAAGK
jgi:hypothetical protein